MIVSWFLFLYRYSFYDLVNLFEGIEKKPENRERKKKIKMKKIRFLKIKIKKLRNTKVIFKKASNI
jgi:hypothetical protein